MFLYYLSRLVTIWTSDLLISWKDMRHVFWKGLSPKCYIEIKVERMYHSLMKKLC